MERTIGAKQKALWKRHGIAERELILEYVIRDKRCTGIRRNEIKGMNSLIVQIEDLCKCQYKNVQKVENKNVQFSNFYSSACASI